MALKGLPYELSQEADLDLEDIFDYTAIEFGIDQAVQYLMGFEELFKLLSINPRMGKERNEIRIGLRSIVKESHIVFYRITSHSIRIVRVLHTSRDIIFYFPKNL